MYGKPGGASIGGGVTGGTQGSVLFIGAAAVLAQDNANFFWDDTNNRLGIGNAAPAQPLDVTGNILLSGSLFIGATDTILIRDAANVLAQRNAASVQTFRLYNTFTDAANYERLNLNWAGAPNEIRLMQESAGTGQPRSFMIGTVGDSGITMRLLNVDRWIFNSTGQFLAATDNLYDIGATGGNRPRDLYLATSIRLETTRGLRATNQTDQAAAQVGTLTNSPVAGNPAFWLPVSVNAVNRSIPCW